MELVFNKETTKLGEEGGKWLHGLIDASLKKDRTYFRQMKDLRMLLTGEHWKILKKSSREQVKMVINLAHAHVRSLVPTVFFKNPSVDCAPTAPQHVGKEKTWNGILNSTMDKTGFKRVMKQVVLDAVLYPEGVMKDIVNKPAQVDERDPETTTDTNETGPTVWLSKGGPSNVRLAPNQLIVDYLSKDRSLESARFIAIRYKKTLQELKLHPIYGKNIKKVLPGTESTPTTGNAVGQSPEEYDSDWDDRKRRVIGDIDEEPLTIYEVWMHQLVSNDGKHQIRRKMCVLVEGQNEPIRELEDWESPTLMGEGFRRYPVTRLVLNPVPDENATSELGVWKSVQVAINWLVSRITSLVENDRLIYMVNMEKIKNPKKFRTQFYQGSSRVLAEVEEPDAIQLAQPSFVGRDNYTLINILQQFLQQVTGFGQNRRGSSGIRTATEVNTIEAGTQIKTDEKTDVVSDFLIEVIDKKAIITRSVVKESGDNRWVFSVSGDVGTVNWIDFTPQDIEWLPEVRLRVGSFRKMDSIQEMQKLAAILQQAIGMFQLYGPVIRVDLIFGRMLEAAGIHDVGKIIGDQDSQTMLQTIEIAAMLSGVEAPVLPGHNHPAHKQTITAFRQSEMGQRILAQAPEAAAILAQHEQLHDQAILEAQQNATNTGVSGQNPFDDGLGGGQQSSPNEPARDVTPVQSVPGGP